MAGKLLTIAEAAALLRVSVPHVRRLIKSGALPARQVSPRVTRIYEEDIDVLLGREHAKAEA